MNNKEDSIEDMLRKVLTDRGDLGGSLPLSYLEEVNYSLFSELEQNEDFAKWALKDVKAAYGLITPFVKKEEEIFEKLYSVALEQGIEVALSKEAYHTAIRETFPSREEYINHRVGMLNFADLFLRDLHEACKNAGPFGDILAELYKAMMDVNTIIKVEEYLPEIESIADRIYSEIA